jgi:transketolase
MTHPDAQLLDHVLEKDKLQFAATRDGYGKGVVTAGMRDERVVVLCADVMESTRLHWFAQKFPERYIELGVAEQNLALVASGMAAYGKIPFMASYAIFSPGRNWEQIRTNICLNNVPVKIIGGHAGIVTGPDGATHQALEDIALMRVLPHMVVVVPCDAVEAEKATLAIAENDRPSYLRVSREKSPVFTSPETPFEIGRAEIFRHPSISSGQVADVALVACGQLVHTALLAAQELAKEGIECTVVNNHTIKPLDENTIARVARETGAVVTIEDHQIAGGMGSAVAEVLARTASVPQEFVGIHNRFGESGSAEELTQAYGLDEEAIKQAVTRVLRRKSKTT